MILAEKTKNAVFAAAFATSALLAAPASAQPSFQLNRFQPSEQTTDGFAISSAETQGHLNVGAQLYLEYNNDSLVYEFDDGSGTEQEFRVVEHQLQGHLNVSLGILDRLTAFVGIPLYIIENGDSSTQLPNGTVDGDAARTAGNAGALPIYLADGFTVGDPYLGVRARLLGDSDDLFVLGLQGRITFPIAQLSSGHYGGENTVSGHPEVLLQFNLGRARIMANLGAHIRDNTPNCEQLDPVGRGPGSNCFVGADVGDEITYGLGATFQAFGNDDHLLWIIAEAHGRLNVQEFGGREETPIELLAGVKYFHTSGVTAGIGGGPGLQRGLGAPDFRVFGMIGFAQGDHEVEAPLDTDGDGIIDLEDECPTEPEDMDSFEDANGCPDPDNDSDGVLDASDECPMEPEDTDGFEDENGCPDPDNDGDGIADDDDGCPNDAEDMDSFEDENGCPDPDNDGDGVLDATDRCPVEAGPSANGGCPWPDADGDGIADPVDSCVNEPGTEEFHGCPEQTEVFIGTTGIEIMDNVYFRTNRDVIQSRSFELLDNVVEILQEHPEITRIRVEGHTDSRGRLSHNMDLSQRRAEAVMRYLVEHGVDAGRLEAQGFGPTRPIVENARRRAEHAQNRRVEFNLVEQGGAQVQQSDNGPSEETVE